ncbi:MAG TPA: methyl-accepting chemotaxis protein, partial [Steroidobacteraceae bacterium]|nr:methyl-accepting chemotaxis protein [Steroidobacteraceae bacterium]
MTTHDDQSLIRTTSSLGRYVTVAVALALLAVASFWFLGRTSSPAGVAATALQSIALDAGVAARGDAAALRAVADNLAELASLAKRSPQSSWVRDRRWATLQSDGAALAQATPALTAAAAAADAVGNSAPAMATEMAAMQTAVPGAAASSAIGRPLDLYATALARIELDVGRLATGSGAQAEIAARLAENTDYVGRVIKGLNGADASLGLPRAAGADATRRAAALGEEFEALNTAVGTVVNAASTLAAGKATAERMASSARALANLAVTGAGSSGPAWLAWVPVGLGLAAILPLLLLLQKFVALRKGVERQRALVDTQSRDNDRNQQAILRLLDELSSLADGDLTVQATVTEDITGAIADSINYAIEALRGLVTTINQSSVQLDSAARQTQALSQHLAKASVAQSKQVASASESAGAMAANTEEISGNAERASDVARHSVDVAHKGGEAVRRTIDGMNAIRETIQETSKRIKRLGESSQEIGSIVELINDIAEQTNILALNASIQASMAGDAGRGFAVVADEVQRLAERAALATKQIEVLVRTIQTDTNEAVVSMERSTTDVVGGALLAENAGAALEEIEQVSNQIASLVQNISSSSKEQSSVAGAITKNMHV